MKRFSMMSFILLLTGAVLAPGNGLSQSSLGSFKSPQLVSRPEVRPPLGSAIGGDVRVLVSIDKKGNVTRAIDVAGPGFVCRQAIGPEVLALRQVAIDAAPLAKFFPATQDGAPVESLSWLTFNFEVQKSESKDANLASTGAPESSSSKYTAIPQPNQSTATATSGGGESKGGLIPGKAISIPKPPYPPAARSVMAEGAVKVRVLIDEKGDIYSAEAIDGHPLLAPAAVTAACTAKFTPTLLQNIPVKVLGTINYNFVP